MDKVVSAHRLLGRMSAAEAARAAVASTSWLTKSDDGRGVAGPAGARSAHVCGGASPRPPGYIT
jgi:hypothetical protein